MEVDENIQQQWIGISGGGGLEMTTTTTQIKYPANYIVILMESLMSILHFSMVDSSTSTPFWPPQRLFNNNIPTTSNNFSQSQQQLINNLKSMAALSSTQKNIGTGPSSIQPTQNIGGTTATNTPSLATTTTTTTSSFSSSNMTSMVGSAISVIPGTGLINNLFGRVFTSTDSSNSSNGKNDNIGKTSEWLEAQKEMIKRLPGVLAILSDIWTFVVSSINENNKQLQQQQKHQKSENKQKQQSQQSSFDTFRVWTFF
ncbi:unnamed protein product [Meloidogyne enterolobii]|uniref:Uncharacterized protein n=1 Tax=Meloidogyne enterolobii TaxID=390850 RepID=A0ACB1APN7_MELEN